MHRYELLPDDALGHLATLVAAVNKAESADLPWRNKARIHFLRNFTIEPVEPYLKFHLLREDIQPVITFGGYDTILQEVLDPESSINRHRPDIIALSLVIEFLDSASGTTHWDAKLSMERLDEFLTRLMDNTSAVIVANTIIPPIDSLHPGQSRPDALHLEQLNDRVREIAGQNRSRIFLSDWVHFMSEIGSKGAIDTRFWKTSQSPFRRDFLNLYAKDIASHARGHQSVAKKCLILDCDNTLWGGVAAEDGLNGIQLHPEVSPGKAYYELQQSILALSARGIMIALCSKNNEQDVWDILDSHPHCLIARSHLVSWRINWQNKADNIDSIAEELNIGVDSIVFVDDSAQECALIREHLPQVTVLQIPENMAAIPEFLTKGGLFDGIANTAEDRQRTQMYQQEAQRRQERGRSRDLTAFLKSLKTNVRIAKAGEDELARVAQLTQKTNQFNLTTRRYSEAEIRKYSASRDAVVFVMSVSDRFGDMGLTGVLIACRTGSTGTVDTLLLSCRCLGRQLEFAFVDQCLRRLEEEWNLEAWYASYVPTRKNTQVADFWDRMEFELKDETSEGKRYVTTQFSRSREYLNIMNVHTE